MAGRAGGIRGHAHIKNVVWSWYWSLMRTTLWTCGYHPPLYRWASETQERLKKTAQTTRPEMQENEVSQLYSASWNTVQNTFSTSDVKPHGTPPVEQKEQRGKTALPKCQVLSQPFPMAWASTHPQVPWHLPPPFPIHKPGVIILLSWDCFEDSKSTLPKCYFLLPPDGPD